MPAHTGSCAWAPSRRNLGAMPSIKQASGPGQQGAQGSALLQNGSRWHDLVSTKPLPTAPRCLGGHVYVSG